jgi:AcrR family transcriptional regulator
MLLRRRAVRAQLRHAEATAQLVLVVESRELRMADAPPSAALSPRSSVSTRPELTPEEERALLLDSAEVVLARGGGRGFKVDSVLRHARLSTRSFYRHFRTKNDLFVALIVRDMERLTERFVALTERSQPPSKAVAEYVHLILDFAYGDGPAHTVPVYTTIWHELRAEHPQLFDEVEGRLLAPLVTLLRRGVQDGEFPTSVPEDDAYAIRAITSWRTMEQTASKPPRPRYEVEASILRIAARLTGGSFVPFVPQ